MVRIVERVMSIVAKFLPLWLLLFSLIAYLIPDAFISIQGLTGFFLGLIFLLMGMSLHTEQIIQTIKKPKYAFIGFVLKWTVMVGVTLIIAFVFFRDNPEIASGFILAGTVPSGTSANLYTFIAGGEVALSLTMATLDTIVAPLITPSFVQVTIGQVVPVDFWALFINIILIVFIPLFTGLFLQWKFPGQVKFVHPYSSIVSQISLLIIILAIVSKAQPTLAENLSVLPFIFLMVFFQVTIPMLGGYFIAKWFKFPRTHVIAVTFHVGICNTALSATLATEHISALAAVPSVVTVIVNLTVGAVVAKIFEKETKQLTMS
ncbi:MAG TPA: bile acid:sodium symporter family protein [Pseudogracilibacillus sp.]|nr:bile acid:sodium symporter family protein [Pseudogracilibacillus sp.]